MTHTPTPYTVGKCAILSGNDIVAAAKKPEDASFHDELVAAVELLYDQLSLYAGEFEGEQSPEDKEALDAACSILEKARREA